MTRAGKILSSILGVMLALCVSALLEGRYIVGTGYFISSAFFLIAVAAEMR